MRTINIPDRLFPEFCDWARGLGLHITYRAETVTAQERHGNGNVVPIRRRHHAPVVQHNDRDPAA